MNWDWMKPPPGMCRTAAGLLEAIAADPLEDTPRVVFADWLEDSGRVDQARFIRRQCTDYARHVEGGDHYTRILWFRRCKVYGTVGKPANFRRLFETGPWNTGEFRRSDLNQIEKDRNFGFVQLCGVPESGVEPRGGSPRLLYHRGFCTGITTVSLWNIFHIVREGWHGWHPWSRRPAIPDDAKDGTEDSPWWPYGRIHPYYVTRDMDRNGPLGHRHRFMYVADFVGGKWRVLHDNVYVNRVDVIPRPIAEFVASEDTASLCCPDARIIPAVFEASGSVLRFDVGNQRDLINVGLRRFLESAASESRRRLIRGEHAAAS